MQGQAQQHKICQALRKAVQKRGVQQFCRSAKIGSTTVYQATDPATGNPSLQTLCRIVNALGFEVYVRPKRSAAASGVANAAV